MAVLFFFIHSFVHPPSHSFNKHCWGPTVGQGRRKQWFSNPHTLLVLDWGSATCHQRCTLHSTSRIPLTVRSDHDLLSAGYGLWHLLRTFIEISWNPHKSSSNRHHPHFTDEKARPWEGAGWCCQQQQSLMSSLLWGSTPHAFSYPLDIELRKNSSPQRDAHNNTITSFGKQPLPAA